MPDARRSKNRAHTPGVQHLHFSLVRAGVQVRRGLHTVDLKTATAPATVQRCGSGDVTIEAIILVLLVML
jgi:hypothetical protein